MGLSAGQRTAALSEAVKDVIGQCRATGKTLVLEALDFAKKKKAEALTGRHRRVLSALAYAEFKSLCLARAHDAGVEVLFVDPSYTSTQGLVLPSFGPSKVLGEIPRPKCALRAPERMPPAQPVRFTVNEPCLCLLLLGEQV